MTKTIHRSLAKLQNFHSQLDGCSTSMEARTLISNWMSEAETILHYLAPVDSTSPEAPQPYIIIDDISVHSWQTQLNAAARRGYRTVSTHFHQIDPPNPDEGSYFMAVMEHNSIRKEIPQK